MEIQRFAEQYMCDAMRLANHFAKHYNAQISEGIGNAADFPFVPKQRDMLEEDVRFFRVEGDSFYGEIAFVTTDTPYSTLELKHRNKSLYRVIVGEQIAALREEKGMTLEEVAEMTGYRAYSLARIEEGRWDIDLPCLGHILDALGATIKLVKAEE